MFPRSLTQRTKAATRPSARGEDWFPETHLIDCMAPTGRQASEALYAKA